MGGLRRFTRAPNVIVPFGLALAVAVLVAVALFWPRVRTIQCDGSVPSWMVPATGHTGCVELLDGPAPAGWDGAWVCLGLCVDP